jgi:hypothetical protein
MPPAAPDAIKAPCCRRTAGCHVDGASASCRDFRTYYPEAMRDRLGDRCRGCGVWRWTPAERCSSTTRTMDKCLFVDVSGLFPRQRGGAAGERGWSGSATRRTVNHPVNAGQNDLSVPASGTRLDAEVPIGFGRSFAPITEITQRRTLEASIGQLTPDREEVRIRHVHRRDIDRRGKAVCVDGNPDLDPADRLSTGDAARKAAWCRATGPTVNHHSTRFLAGRRAVPIVSGPPMTSCEVCPALEEE